MLTVTGARETPFCDDCFGSGKTSLICKFRTVLASHDSWMAPKGYGAVKNAIYLYINFTKDDSVRLCDLEYQSSSTYDRLLLNKISIVLERSARGQLLYLDCTDANKFVERLNSVAPVKFIFHFDDIGSLESINGKEVATLMIYRLWIIADKLRENGNFFAITGRSEILRGIGNSIRLKTNHPNTSLTDYTSPDIMRQIPLPPLEKSSIIKILEEKKKMFPKVRTDAEFVDWVFDYTLGIPRAIYAVLRYFILTQTDEHEEKEKDFYEHIAIQIKSVCKVSTYQESDTKLYYRLLEISWAGFEISKLATINEELISSVIARLGMYQLLNKSTEMFRIIIPNFLIDQVEQQGRSLFAIAQYEDNGGRLESAARRSFFIRCSITKPTTWKSLNLSILDDEGIVFPKTSPTAIFPFPKICKKNKWTELEVIETMKYFHEKVFSDQIKTEFSIDALPEICGHMLIGQYYQSLPRSGSADALIRLNDNTILEIQFKNYQNPINRSEIINNELEKSSIDGWNCYLIVICTSGHNESECNDLVFSPESKNNFVMKVVVLSRQSVIKYLGLGTVNAIGSISSVSDLVERMKL